MVELIILMEVGCFELVDVKDILAGERQLIPTGFIPTRLISLVTSSKLNTD